MTVLTTYYLEPPAGQAALSFHFGRQGIGMEEASETLASDSLFAALVAQAALLDPPAPDAPLAFALPFVRDDSAPPFTLSSLFPRLDTLILLPRPALQLRMAADLHDKIGKGFKKLRYLSPGLFSTICTGRQINDQPIIMQQGTVWISLEEARQLPPPWQRASGESDLVWLARLKDTPIWQIESQPHVTVDRVSNTSAYFEVGKVTYTPGAGLALLVAFADATARFGFERLLSLLGESGLGGRRSSGSGAFSWRRDPDLALDLGWAGRRRVLLSRYLPREAELDALRSEHAAYQLVNIGGWLYSTGAPAQRRQRVRMVAEGSVLDAEAITGALRGKVEDVRPDYRKSKREHPIFKREQGTSHPVYRSGLALALPIPDQEGL